MLIESDNTPRRLMQVHTFYTVYLDEFYAQTPGMKHEAWEKQTKALIADGFSAIHMLAPYVSSLGWQSELVIANCRPLQAAWAAAHGINLPDRDWEDHILLKRIETFRPDVLYLGDSIRHDTKFLRKLQFCPRLILGWRGADVPAQTDWSDFDIILSALPKMLSLAVSLGAKEGVYFTPGVPNWIARAVEDIPQDIDVVFAGSLSPTQHVHRLKWLEILADAADAQGFSLAAHLNYDPRLLSPALRRYVRPPVYGLAMHQALRRGKIVFDDRAQHGVIMPDGRKKIDLGGEDTANMRLFEGTAGGSLVLTEHLEGLKKLFEPDEEVATFKDETELTAKIRYYLDHPEERQRIADNGRRRCLAQYNMTERAREFVKIITDRLV